MACAVRLDLKHKKASGLSGGFFAVLYVMGLGIGYSFATLALDSLLHPFRLPGSGQHRLQALLGAVEHG